MQPPVFRKFSASSWSLFCARTVQCILPDISCCFSCCHHCLAYQSSSCWNCKLP